MSAPDPHDPSQPTGDAPDTAPAPQPDPEPEPFATDRQRAGWGPANRPAYDRRTDERRRAERRDEARLADDAAAAAEERREAERREAARRADDRFLASLAARPATDRAAADRAAAEHATANHAAAGHSVDRAITDRAMAEPPSMRVPQVSMTSPADDGAAGAGRLLAILLVIILAFAGGAAVDQAAWRGGAALPPASTPAPAASGAVRPPATSLPGTSGAPDASGTTNPGTSAAPGSPAASPVATAGPTIGPGSTVAPFAPANVGILWDALQIIRDHWVRRAQLNPTDLTYGLLNGLVDSLGDPGHTVFLTPEQVKSENESLSGKITGIGVYLGVLGGTPIVQSVVSGSPAARAGVLSGDRILAIDGTSAENLSVEEIARLVRGPVGTQVTLTVLHPRGNSPVDIPITRATITVPAVAWSMIPGTTLADIRIGEFSSGTTDQFTTALRGARQAGATGVVLDLRNNPGGYVDDAVGVASQLLASGTVYIRRTADGTQIPVPVKPDGIGTDIPLVVLVDYGSASSAEITAGALQDNHRGQVVGTRTYGTGTVLNTFGLPDGSAIRLGVEEWLTPGGTAIFPNGIQPDQEVDLATDMQPLEPDALHSMTAIDLQASGDTQLLRAIQILATR